MPDRLNHPKPVNDPGLPPSLVEALGGLHRHAVEVPRSIDESILREARAGYVRRRRFRMLARAGMGTAAAAAAVVIAVVTYTSSDRRTRAPMVVKRDLPADLDRNGRVDILDAFILAKKVEAKTPVGPGDDVNSDGRVDRTDVEVLATLAVTIEQREQS